MRYPIVVLIVLIEKCLSCSHCKSCELVYSDPIPFLNLKENHPLFTTNDCFKVAGNGGLGFCANPCYLQVAIDYSIPNINQHVLSEQIKITSGCNDNSDTVINRRDKIGDIYRAIHTVLCIHTSCENIKPYQDLILNKDYRYVPTCKQCSFRIINNVLYHGDCDQNKFKFKMCFGICISTLFQQSEYNLFYSKDCFVPGQLNRLYTEFDVSYDVSYCMAKLYVPCNNAHPPTMKQVLLKEYNSLANRNDIKVCLSCRSVGDDTSNEYLNCLKGTPSTLFNIMSCDEECISYIYSETDSSHVIRGCKNSILMQTIFDIEEEDVVKQYEIDRYEIGCRGCQLNFEAIEDFVYEDRDFMNLTASGINECFVYCTLMGGSLCKSVIFYEGSGTCSIHYKGNTSAHVTSYTLPGVITYLVLPERDCPFYCYVKCVPGKQICNGIDVEQLREKILNYYKHNASTMTETSEFTGDEESVYAPKIKFHKQALENLRPNYQPYETTQAPYSPPSENDMNKGYQPLDRGNIKRCAFDCETSKNGDVLMRNNTESKKINMRKTLIDKIQHSSDEIGKTIKRNTKPNVQLKPMKYRFGSVISSSSSSMESLAEKAVAEKSVGEELLAERLSDDSNDRINIRLNNVLRKQVELRNTPIFNKENHLNKPKNKKYIKSSSKSFSSISGYSSIDPVRPRQRLAKKAFLEKYGGVFGLSLMILVVAVVETSKTIRNSFEKPYLKTGFDIIRSGVQHDRVNLTLNGRLDIAFGNDEIKLLKLRNNTKDPIVVTAPMNTNLLPVEYLEKQGIANGTLIKEPIELSAGGIENSTITDLNKQKLDKTEQLLIEKIERSEKKKEPMLLRWTYIIYAVLFLIAIIILKQHIVKKKLQMKKKKIEKSSNNFKEVINYEVSDVDVSNVSNTSTVVES